MLATADSVYHLVRTAAEARAAAKRLHLQVSGFTHVVGNTGYPQEIRASMARLEHVGAGQLYPGVLNFRGIGCVIEWVDSISAPGTVTWDQVRSRALEGYRMSAGSRVLEAKRAELDSLSRLGWPFDSLAALYGGVQHVKELAPAAGLPKLAGAQVVDSLVFGGSRAAALGEGEISDWIRTPIALVRVRLNQRVKPDPSKLASRMESERRGRVEHGLYGFYEELKHRYPVRILDPELRGVTVPPPPEPTSL
jgi:hypothetical protein